MYVTYGLGNKLDISKIKTDLYCQIGKPKQAFWGSPVDADFGWKEWCYREECIPTSKGLSFDDYFSDDNKILWDLKEGTKVLMINEVEDLDEFIDKKYIVYVRIFPNSDFKDYVWNFNKILEDGYSAIQLNDATIGHNFRSNVEILLSSWDCESIVVLDKSKIVQVE